MIEPLSFLAGFLTVPILTATAIFIIITIEVAYDLGVIAGLTAICYVAMGWWLGWYSLIWVITNWPEMLLLAGIYILVGIFWCIIKWWLYLRTVFEWLNKLILTDPTYAKSCYKKPPQVSEQKQDIMRWMMWWPFSFIAWVCSDFFGRIFETIYRNIAKLLQQMSDRMFAKIKFPD